MINLNKIKKLYKCYSPLKTNKTLLNTYYRLFEDNHFECIRQQYNDIINCNYVNEAVIKAAFVKQNLYSRSPKINTVIFELNSLDSRADLALINSFSSVYEIKTEYDNYSRLESQLKDYEKLFEYIYIIIPKSEIRSVKKLLSHKIGIITYQQNDIFEILFNYEREASFNNKILARDQLTSLTKKELLKLNNKHNDYSIDKETLIKNLVSSLSAEEINVIYKDFLKEKYRYQWNFLYNNLMNIFPLDYQFFFKYTVDYNIIYK